MFKRRDPRSWSAWLREMVYPSGGFRRATQYVLYRMKRLPDQPERVARGVFAGSLIGFLPLPGLQFVSAWLAARLVKGNLLAALLATFNTNPVTTPFFAVLAMTLGHWIMGIEAPLNAEYIASAFAQAGSDLWHNVLAIFTDRTARWDGLVKFWHEIYVPYFIGALGPGLILSIIAYYITLPLVTAYQKARASRQKERSERRRLLRAMVDKASSAPNAARDVTAPGGKGQVDTPPDQEGDGGGSSH